MPVPQRMRYPVMASPDRLAASGRAGDWLSGRAPRSHRGGHWFDPSIAHRGQDENSNSDSKDRTPEGGYEGGYRSGPGRWLSGAVVVRVRSTSSTGPAPSTSRKARPAIQTTSSTTGAAAGSGAAK